ncbi:protein kinase domain-containing protein [Streptomyces oceani]|uniref:serine/threonine-protein kinase n=1 Tax=Streptomyces oceani TaxID=1075402 RepID=UPI000AC1EF64|nr:serine/threonine-protein kinase [Streptomyces oceani]
MPPSETPPATLGFPLAYDDPMALGPFRLVARLGGGGMGTVYLGRDAGGRTVALKTMHARIATDPEFRLRFRLETDAARVIGGQHGAEVVDADPLAPTPWLATEYVLGPPLDEAVERCGPLPERSVRALGAALCGALGQLHSSDVVHRDLKPSNILLTAFGPKVIDFGIARAIGDERLTRTGTAAGTPAYMSPEQATGGEHTAAGDVFALAGVLVHALSGHGPFGGGQAADLLYRVRYGEPDLSGVPESLHPVLRRCLLKEPQHRPDTTRLGAWLHDGHGEFADQLPECVLTLIAWRAGAVWRISPRREPAPPGTSHPDSTGRGPLAGPGADPPYSLGSADTRDAHSPKSGPPRHSRRRVLTMLSGAALSVSAIAAGGAWAWSRFGEDGSPGEGPGHGPGGRPNVAWEAATLSENEGYDLPPIAASGLVLCMDEKGLVALDAATGKRRWDDPELHAKRISTDGERVCAILPEPGGPRPTDPREKESAGGDAGEGLTLYELDPLSGARRRLLGGLPDFDGRDITRDDEGTIPAAPTVQPLRTHGDLLYLAARKRESNLAREEISRGWYLVAFDLRAGRELWREPLADYLFAGRSAQASAYVVTHRGEHVMLTRSAEGESERELWLVTLARKARTGGKQWDTRVRLGVSDSLGTSLAPIPADNDRLYFASRQVTARRLTDGGEDWSYVSSRTGQEETDDNGFPVARYGPPALRDGVVYAVERGRGLVALDASDGRLLWREKGSPAEGLRHSLGCAPLVGEKYVHVVLEDNRQRTDLSAVSRETHRSEWTFTRGGPDGVGSRLVADEEAGRIIGTTTLGTFAIPLE